MLKHCNDHIEDTNDLVRKASEIILGDVLIYLLELIRYSSALESNVARVSRTLDLRLAKVAELEYNLDIGLLKETLDQDCYKIVETVPIDVHNDDNASFDLWDLGETVTFENNSSNLMEKELDRFKLQPQLERGYDLVQFWLMQKMAFPRIYNVAIDYIAVPASSVPCERANSLAEHAFEGRERLSDTTFCAEMCVRSWIKLFKLLGKINLR